MTEKYNHVFASKSSSIGKIFLSFCFLFAVKNLYVSLLSSVDFDEDACCDRTDPKQMDTAGGSVETKDGLFGGWE